MSHATLSERIADEIVEQIRAAGLRPGDALIPSLELAKQFEVTTPTVREALRRLEAVDIIHFRHGSGTYVGNGINRRLLANPHRGRPDRRSMLELLDARLTLEPEIAARAALHRTEAQLADLAEATGNALTVQQGDERPELHFHVAVAAATDNPLLRDTIQALLDTRARDQVGIRKVIADRT